MSRPARMPGSCSTAPISDVSLPQITDKDRLDKDRYGIDFAKKPRRLTMALNVDRQALVKDFVPTWRAVQDRVAPGRKSPSEAMSEAIEKRVGSAVMRKCGRAIEHIHRAFFQTAFLAQAYPDEYGALKEAVDFGAVTIAAAELPALSPSQHKPQEIDPTKRLPRPCRPDPGAASSADVLEEAAASTQVTKQMRPSAEAPKVSAAYMESLPAQVDEGKPSREVGASGDPFVLKDYFEKFKASAPKPEGNGIDLKLVLTLRSVEGIIYYLGEYVRNGNGPCVAGNDGPVQVPILVIEPGEPEGNSPVFVTVSHAGHDYWVPLTGGTVTDKAGRSSQVINIVQQLLNLHRSSKDLLSVQSVRVTN